MRVEWGLPLDRPDLIGCGEHSCTWASYAPDGRDCAIKITDDEQTVAALDKIRRSGSSYDSILVRVYWVGEALAPTDRNKGVWIIVAELLEPLSSFAELGASRDRIMGKKGVDLSRALKKLKIDQGALELHSGNWGFRDPDDQESLVFFDFSFSGESLRGRETLPRLNAKPLRRNSGRHFVVRSPEQGLDVINHPAIAGNFAKALRWKPQADTAVLLPCAGTKPFPEAPSHGGYLDALEGKDVDLWVVSEPLGVVPYQWSRTWPNFAYDFPPKHLRGAAWDAMVERVGRWLDVVAPKYEKVWLALPGHHERLVREALEDHDPGNVRDATHTKCLSSGSCPPGHGRSTSHQYRRFLREAVRNPAVQENPTCWERLSERERVRHMTLAARDDAAIRRRDFPTDAWFDGDRVSVLGPASDLTGRPDAGARKATLLAVRVIDGPDAGVTAVVPSSSVTDDSGRPWRRKLPARCPSAKVWSNPPRRTWLFSYGSNSPEQLEERLGHPVAGVGASVSGFRRVFRGWSQRWGGGVASLEDARGATTYGWAAQVSESDLVTLDRHEGVATGNYRRAKVRIELADGRGVDAVAYVSTSSEHNRPSTRYLEACARTVGSFWSEDDRPVTAGDFPIR